MPPDAAEARRSLRFTAKRYTGRRSATMTPKPRLHASECFSPRSDRSTWTTAPPLVTEVDDREGVASAQLIEPAGQRVRDGATAREFGLDEAPLELLDGGGANEVQTRLAAASGPRGGRDPQVVDFALAERRGFEPLVPCGTPDFESGTFGLSVISPPETLRDPDPSCQAKRLTC
jgi:hypothetical protein